MKFGVREICDVVFKAKQTVTIGDITFTQGQPVLYIDSAKTSTIESTATTVYAQGGRGNARLITWEGEKTLTFTVEDALLSPIGFAVLSGAGLFKPNKTENKEVAMVHRTAKTKSGDKIFGIISQVAPIFVSKVENGSIGQKVTATVDNQTYVLVDANGTPVENATLTQWETGLYQDNGSYFEITVTDAGIDDEYFVDFYEARTAGVHELVIDAENFGGYYYVEASTLFRRESDGKDLPAEIVFPKVKVQSNFTFNMSSSGDPSTFSFVMDAMPDYTMFERNKKTLCAIQIIDDTIDASSRKPVLTLAHNGDNGAQSEFVDSKILSNDSVEATK